MMTLFTEFHWMRPQAFFASIPLLLLLLLLWQKKRSTISWRNLIAPELLEHLVDRKSLKPAQNLLWGLMAAWLLATLAIAGPVWEKQPTPVHRQADALIIVLDLSPSMVSEDIKPKRIVRARLKIADILKRRIEGETALIVYAGDAHVVTPLTDDNKTISALLPTLTPALMPLPGSQTEAGISRGIKMLNDSGLKQGTLLLVTDGVEKTAEKEIRNLLKNTDYQLSILGVGTDKGAPIPSSNGGFLRDKARNVIISKLRSGNLQSLAQATGGRYITSHYTEKDLDYLLDNTFALPTELRETNNNIDAWVERGPWLVLLILPILLFAFRRGVILCVFLLPLFSLYTPNTQAVELKDLWLTPNQQANNALATGDNEVAAEKFTHPEWKAAASYRAGQFAEAAELLSDINTADAHYNRGNALARANKLDDAITAYQKALAIEPDMLDASDNKALVEALKKQQEQQEKDEQQENDDSDDEQENEDSDKEDDKENSEESSEEKSDEKSDSDDSSSEPSDNSNDPSEPEDDSRPKDEQEKSDTENNQDEAEDENSEAQAEEEENENASEEEQPITGGENAEMSPEEEQAMEQWLRQIPDDPGGLLRNKFKHQYMQSRQERMQQKLNPFNEQEERW